MIERRVSELLASSPTLEIATYGDAPWIAAAYFAEDGPFVLQLMLETRGLTLANLRAHPRVAVMVQSGDAMAPFAQADGHAEIADDADGFRARLIAKTPASAPLVSLPDQVPVRIYIDRWRITDVPAGWLPARELRAPAAVATGGRP